MKKEMIVHFTFLIGFFLIISLFKSWPLSALPGGWFDLPYLLFWLGGIIGVMLVYVDHFVYAYFLKPNEASSQKATELVEQKKVGQATEVLVESHDNVNLIFHNARFQTVFLLFMFFVITSTGSLVGRGIVLGFSLHLLVDMVREFVERKDFDKWFREFPMAMDVRQKKYYMLIHVVLLLWMGLFF